MLKRIALYIMIVFCLTSCSAMTGNMSVRQDANEGQTAALYQEMLSADNGKPNVAMLNLFFTRMPKGGDIHHHYTGSIYAETYLEWVQAQKWFIDSCSLKIVTTKGADACRDLTVEELLKDNTLYRKLLMAWSDKDYDNHFYE